ncbi:tail fiber assembly protein [Salmonella enterica]|uniref:Tail fiber assembly protein n=2 Tax=Salmonella enterica TaxID=28901 RepID=A0A5Y5JVC5_SALER|nr:tail fiber assembly protein [Salmonella enterica]EBW3715396.1 hypothetical protein [Salmonella enterica subsp. enterica serovar Glostrup]EBY2176220.1 hypothetical protein [Salmonella enterica subsp. enterica serovar Umbilo]ECI4010047.1 hypothetical protein [Salmonella enterica subsp. salamae]ECT9621028.1 hypothetical protein [Salmonella enterica subsp. enterica serovar Bovismorbificans]EDV4533123.1 tail fiber assembly protein [Salmonella enterica subsp. enterica]EHC1063786.1 tail fiber ass
MATDDEKSQLAEWKKYRIPVNWVDAKKHRILTDRGLKGQKDMTRM